MLHVFAEETGVEAEDAARQAVLRVGDLQLHGFLNKAIDFLLELGRPSLRILGLDAVDKVETEVHVNGFIAHDVLELFANPGHAVAAMEGQDHHEA